MLATKVLANVFAIYKLSGPAAEATIWEIRGLWACVLEYLEKMGALVKPSRTFITTFCVSIRLEPVITDL